jgi:CHAD domain-containing protein
MAKAFEQGFRRNIDWVKVRLEAHIEDPNSEKRIHDMRTSLRRLDATFLVLPKSLRKKNRKEIDRYKEFFKANGKVRDYDVIIRRLAALEAPPGVMVALRKQRNQEIRNTLHLAKSLQRMTPMKLNGISDDKLNDRVNEVLANIANKVERLLPIVLSNSTKVKDLHSLRKNCKKLRYILEVAPRNCKKKYDTIIINCINNKSLEEMQAILGAIHDSDITMEYLQNLKSPLVEKEASHRKRQYAAFVRYMRKK